MRLTINTNAGRVERYTQGSPYPLAGFISRDGNPSTLAVGDTAVVKFAGVIPNLLDANLEAGEEYIYQGRKVGYALSSTKLIVDLD